MKQLAVTLALIVVAAASADASSFHAWGKLAKYKKTEFRTLSYKALDGRRLKSFKAYVTLGEGVSYFRDRRIQLAAIKEGDTIWIYGAMRETEGRTPEGTNFVDRQLSNTQAVLIGDGFPTFAPAGGKDAVGWRRASVIRNGGSLMVSLGGEYKVSCVKDVVVLQRTALEEAPELKKKALMEVRGQTSTERPEKAKQGEVGVTASRLVLLDPSAQAAYMLLLPPDEAPTE